MTQSGMYAVLLIVVVVFTTFFGSYALPLVDMLYNSNSLSVYPN